MLIVCRLKEMGFIVITDCGSIDHSKKSEQNSDIT